jgi:hypothetical protein
MSAVDAVTAKPQPYAPHGPAGGVGARLAWTGLGVVLALAGIGIWVNHEVRMEFNSSFAAIPAHRRVFDGSVRRLVVSVDSGSVIIQRSSGSATTVETTGIRTSEVPTDHERIVGTTLYLRSTCGPPGFVTQGGNYCSRNYRVELPGSVSVDTTLATGNLAIDGMRGAVDATVATGNVTVRDGTGSLDVKTGAGSVAVYHQDGAVAVATGTGNVLVADVHGPVDVNSSNGTVAVTRASTAVRISEQTGYVDATGLLGGTVTVTVANGPIDLGFTAPPQQVDASTQTGGVTVHVPYGNVQYQLDLHTGTGHVVTSIPSDPSSTHVIRVLTENGDILVGPGATTPPPPIPPIGPSS